MTPLVALALAGGHSGVVHARTGPELSDFALFVVAGIGVWLVRRALRRRFADKTQLQHRSQLQHRARQQHPTRNKD